MCVFNGAMQWYSAWIYFISLFWVRKPEIIHYKFKTFSFSKLEKSSSTVVYISAKRPIWSQPPNNQYLSHQSFFPPCECLIIGDLIIVYWTLYYGRFLLKEAFYTFKVCKVFKSPLKYAPPNQSLTIVLFKWYV